MKKYIARSIVCAVSTGAVWSLTTRYDSFLAAMLFLGLALVIGFVAMWAVEHWNG